MEHDAQYWQACVLSQEWLARIDAKALKRFSQPGLAEEAAAFVLNYLSDEDWKRCKQFSQKASLEGYLNRLISNALEDFSRRRFSRPRPPSWLQRQGRFWVELWQRLCLERQLAQTLIDSFSGGGQREPLMVSEAISEIYRRIPHCGEVNMERQAPEEHPEIGDHQDHPQGVYGQNNSALIALMASLLIEPDDSNTRERIEPFLEPLLVLKESLTLSAEQQLLLRLVYEDGLNLKQASQALGLAPHQSGRQLKRALAHIKDQFLAANISKDELMEALQ